MVIENIADYKGPSETSSTSWVGQNFCFAEVFPVMYIVGLRFSKPIEFGVFFTTVIFPQLIFHATLGLAPK